MRVKFILPLVAVLGLAACDYKANRPSEVIVPSTPEPVVIDSVAIERQRQIEIARAKQEGRWVYDAAVDTIPFAGLSVVVNDVAVEMMSGTRSVYSRPQSCIYNVSVTIENRSGETKPMPYIGAYSRNQEGYMLASRMMFTSEGKLFKDIEIKQGRKVEVKYNLTGEAAAKQLWFGNYQSCEYDDPRLSFVQEATESTKLGGEPVAFIVTDAYNSPSVRCDISTLLDKPEN